MTIETYAKQIGINATAEQLEKLQEYMQHKPSVGEVYLIPLTVTFPSSSIEGDVASMLPDGAELLLKSEYFTLDRLASNQPQGLTAKFKVGQLTNEGRVRQVLVGYRLEDCGDIEVWAENELKLVEEAE